VATAPVMEILIKRDEDSVTVVWNSVNMRAIPYPPSFSKIAAKTIDPAIGASTCALGSHKCAENIGSLTKNPIMVIIQNILLIA